MTTDQNKGEKVKREELVVSFSKHSKLSNKYMAGLLFCCITFAMNISPTEKIKLPFVGDITIEYYYWISMALISCLIILFSSTHLMALRIREYYCMHFNKINDKDYIDLTVEPTIFRMAPIAWMIKNKNIFFTNIEAVHQNWKKFELIIYFLLKILVFIVAYLFPTVVLIIILWKSGIFDISSSINIIIRILLVSLSVISIISFCIVWKNEIIFTLRMPQKIFNNQAN